MIEISFRTCVFPVLRELCVYGHECAPTILAGLPEWPQRLWTHPQQHQTALAQWYVFISNITSASCDSWGQRSNLIFGKGDDDVSHILSRCLRHSVVSPPLCSRLKYLNNYWMDCHKIWYRYPPSLWWSPDIFCNSISRSKCSLIYWDISTFTKNLQRHNLVANGNE